MAVFKCKMCGGDLEVNDNITVGTCQYCGSTMTIPRIDDEKRTNLYNRANHFRRNSDFDKAMGVYESILSEDSTDPEAYWGIVLCEYGVDYVEDPKTHKRVITCHRTQYTSIFADENYKSALEYADLSAKSIYEEEASIIENIQKQALAISNSEEPFDVFICYKEVDDAGKRTQDSVLAQDIYYQLTEAGYKVFFSRITLEDKIGQEYEPYIFAALNSAKVMVALGTKVEYFNAVWVKNEWSRFLYLIRNGESKSLIPAYKDIDPYDLPEEFGVLQAQDMSKLGFIQDLIRGIKKICDETQNVNTTVVNNTENNNQIESLIKRVYIFLEDGDFDKANEYCEKVLDLNPEEYRAYLGKAMVDFLVCKKDDLRLFRYSVMLTEDDENYIENNKNYIENNKNYIKAIKFANGNLKDLEDRIKSERIAFERKIKEEECKRIERSRLMQEYLEQKRLTKKANKKVNQKKKKLLKYVVIGLIIGSIFGTIINMISNDTILVYNIEIVVFAFIAVAIPISLAYGRGKTKGVRRAVYGSIVGIIIGGITIFSLISNGFETIIIFSVIAAFCGLMIGVGILSNDNIDLIPPSSDLKEPIDIKRIPFNPIYDDDVKDDLWVDVITSIVNKGYCSTSTIQRQFKIGYNRAGRLVDLMEANGIVGPLDGAKPRDVLMTRMELEEYIQEYSNNE